MASLLPNGYNPQTLQDVISQSAGSQTANLTDQYTQARKRAVSGEAASGRLMSGVSNYPLTDIDTQYQKGLSGIQTNEANTLAGIPSEDWLNNNEFQNQLSLTNQIADQMKPSTLDEIFQGIGSIGPTVAMAAMMA